MNYRVIIEPPAVREIRIAYDWASANRSPKSAVKWFNGLERAIASLKTRPQRCPVADENDRFPEEIRVQLYGKRQKAFRILFTIREDAVHVLYFRHASRDEIQPDLDAL